MHRTLPFAALAAVIVVALLPASVSAEPNDYGAIAYSPVKKTIGHAIAGRRDAAEKGAVKNCKSKGGSSNCQVYTWFTNAWGALAESSNGHVGSGWAWESAGSDQARAAARKYAVESCARVRGKNCHVTFDMAAGDPRGPGTGGFGPDYAYVALGDSYSSGEGNRGYVPPTDTPANKCHRSPHAYGVRLQHDVPTLGRLVFHACSGAVTDDFYTKGASNGSRHNLGEKRQLDYLTGETVSVTLTIGGNDLGFGEAMQSCLQSFGCSEKDRKLVRVVNARLAALRTGNGATAPQGRRIHAVTRLLADVHGRARNARIFVGGYPRLFGTNKSYYRKNRHAPSGRTCYVGNSGLRQVFIDFNDAQWLNEMVKRLDEVLSRAVGSARARGVPVAFVPVQGSFSTHGLCDSGRAWITPLQRESHPPGKSQRQESFHPTVAGQQAYEKNFRKAEGV